MASHCEVCVYAPDEATARGWSDAAIAEVRRIETKYSRYRDDSVTTAINRAAGGAAISVDTETASLLDFAAELHAQSDGAFDLTSGVLRRAWDFKTGRVPAQAALDQLLPRVGWSKIEWRSPTLRLRAEMEIDFGGIGKEYAADRAAADHRGTWRAAWPCKSRRRCACVWPARGRPSVAYRGPRPARRTWYDDRAPECAARRNGNLGRLRALLRARGETLFASARPAHRMAGRALALGVGRGAACDCGRRMFDSRDVKAGERCLAVSSGAARSLPGNRLCRPSVFDVASTNYYWYALPV